MKKRQKFIKNLYTPLNHSILSGSEGKGAGEGTEGRKGVLVGERGDRRDRWERGTERRGQKGQK
jgi:hypothetical protein